MGSACCDTYFTIIDHIEWIHQLLHTHETLCYSITFTFSPPATCLLPWGGHLGWQLPEAECSSRRWVPSRRWGRPGTLYWSRDPRDLWEERSKGGGGLMMESGLILRHRLKLLYSLCITAAPATVNKFMLCSAGVDQLHHVVGFAVFNQ